MLDLLVDFELVVGPLIDHADTQVPGAVADDPGLSSSDERDLNAGAQQQADAVAVTDVEAFDLLSPVIHDDAAVGQHAVYVEQ